MLPVAEAPTSTRPVVAVVSGKSVSASEFAVRAQHDHRQRVGAGLAVHFTYSHVVSAGRGRRVDLPGVIAHATAFVIGLE